MKKVLSMAMVLALALGAFGVTSHAAESNSDSVTVNVTIADKGQLAVTQDAVTVTDIDDDGALTIHDALYAAHEAEFEGGAAAGYASYSGDYGLSMSKLWGDESGCFGYQLNHASALSLADPVKEGDSVYAYVYSDQITWSDAYSYFNVNTVSAQARGEITLTLSSAGYDAEWNPVTLPVEGATITLSGKATEYKTDAEGKVTLRIEEAGEYIISARSETKTLVPPVCMATVEADATEAPETDIPETGDHALTFALIAFASLALMVVCTARRRKNHEN